MITYLGSVAIGAAMPQISLSLGQAYADLQARVNALLQFSPGAVDFSAQLSLLVQMTANIEAMISLGITPPSISAQIKASLALVAELEGQLALILGLQNGLGVTGMHAYAYQGPANALGAEFAAQLSGGFPGGLPTDSTNALLFATTIPACWAAMQQIFKTTP